MIQKMENYMIQKMENYMIQKMKIYMDTITGYNTGHTTVGAEQAREAFAKHVRSTMRSKRRGPQQPPWVGSRNEVKGDVGHGGGSISTTNGSNKWIQQMDPTNGMCQKWKTICSSN